MPPTFVALEAGYCAPLTYGVHLRLNNFNRTWPYFFKRPPISIYISTASKNI